jgi:hypothetical protein
MLYDKTKEATNCWSWYHYSLSLDLAKKLYRDDLSPKFGNSIPDGKGLLRFQNRKVLFQYFPRTSDDRNREHWVLLLAWPPEGTSFPEAWAILEDEVFKYVASGKDDIPKILSQYEYNPDYIKLTYFGGAGTVPADKGRDIVENIERRGKVDIAFYCEKSNGKAEIVTSPRSTP